LASEKKASKQEEKPQLPKLIGTNSGRDGDKKNVGKNTSKITQCSLNIKRSTRKAFPPLEESRK